MRRPHGWLVLLLAVVAAGTLARCYRIQAPLVGLHDWRLCDTAAMARNFYEESMNIFYPRIDWRGSTPGYVEAEFPIFAYLVAILYHVTGQQEWVARAANIAIYAASALLLFALVRRLFSDRVALFAVFFYSFGSLSLFYTRSVQPDPLMAFCSLAGIYAFWMWTEKRSWLLLVTSALAVTVAVLIKPTSLHLGLPLAYLAYRKLGWGFFRIAALWAFAGFVFTAAIFWFLHSWNLWNQYGNTMGIFGVPILLGRPGLTDRLWLAIGKRLLLRIVFETATLVSVPFLVAGFLRKPAERNYLLHAWAIGFAISILVAPRGHLGHDYYLLPMVFVATGWMGYGAGWAWETARHQQLVRALVLVMCLASAWLGFKGARSWLRRTDIRLDQIAFGQKVNELTTPGALVVFCRLELPPWHLRHRTEEGIYLGSDPLDFYFSHRKGWSIDASQASPELLDKLRGRGAKYFATFYPEIFARDPGLKRMLDQSYNPVEVTAKWAIYSLREPPHKAVMTLHRRAYEPRARSGRETEK